MKDQKIINNEEKDISLKNQLDTNKKSNVNLSNLAKYKIGQDIAFNTYEYDVYRNHIQSKVARGIILEVILTQSLVAGKPEWNVSYSVLYDNKFQKVLEKDIKSVYNGDAS